MKGYTFHAAMPVERGSKSASKAYPFQPWTRATLKAMAERGELADVVALVTDERGFISRGEWMRGAVCSIFSHPNSDVCYGSVGNDWLRKRTTRIDEATARKLHPALFRYLDSAP